LARYSLIANQENGAIGFRQYIPVEVLDHYGVTAVIKATASVNSYSQHNLLYNSGGKALEELLHAKVLNGMIENNSGVSEEIVRLYVDKINKNNGREDFKAVGSKVEVLNKETEYFVSNFVRQYFQHNPSECIRVNLKNTTAKDKVVSTIESFAMTKEIDNPIDFVHLVDGEGKVYLFEHKGDLKYVRIGTLGSFGMNEYDGLNGNKVSMLAKNRTNKVFDQSVTPFDFDSVTDEGDMSYSLTEALHEIANKDSEYAQFASFFMKYHDPDVKVVYTDRINAVGAYVSKDKTIYIRQREMEDLNMDDAVLHEYLHSITQDLINQYVDLSIDEKGKLIVEYKTDTVPQGLAKLVSVYKFAMEKIMEEKGVDNFMKLYKGFKEDKRNVESNVTYNQEDMDTYFASDINEFIAGIFFDEHFKNKMSSLEYKSSEKSLLRNFVEALLKMYNTIFTGENTVAQHTVDALTDLLETSYENKGKLPNPISTQTISSDMLIHDENAQSLIDDNDIGLVAQGLYEIMERRDFKYKEITSFIDDREYKGYGTEIFVPGHSDLNIFMFNPDEQVEGDPFAAVYIVNGETGQLILKPESNETMGILEELIQYMGEKIYSKEVENLVEALKKGQPSAREELEDFLRRGDVDDVEEC
jgi:hypothetical protein